MSPASYLHTFDLAAALGAAGDADFDDDALHWLLTWVLARWSLFATRWRVEEELTKEATGLLTVIGAERDRLRELVSEVGAGKITAPVLAAFEAHIQEIENARNLVPS